MEIYPCCKNIPLRAKNIPFLQTQTYRAKNIPLLQKTMTACKNNTFDDFENAITIRKCSIHALAFLGGGLSQDYGRCARMKTRRVSRGGELIHVFALHIHAWRCTFMFSRLAFRSTGYFLSISRIVGNVFLVFPGVVASRTLRGVSDHKERLHWA